MRLVRRSPNSAVLMQRSAIVSSRTAGPTSLVHPRWWSPAYRAAIAKPPLGLPPRGPAPNNQVRKHISSGRTEPPIQHTFYIWTLRMTHDVGKCGIVWRTLHGRRCVTAQHRMCPICTKQYGEGSAEFEDGHCSVCFECMACSNAGMYNVHGSMEYMLDHHVESHGHNSSQELTQGADSFFPIGLGPAE